MTVRIEKNGHVWTVIHSRAEARNGMDADSAQALCDAFIEYENDPEARVAVLWGEGGNFCAGWDLKYAASLSDKEKFQKDIIEGLAFPPGANPAPRGPTRLELTKPVIGAVEGAAVAGGMELAMWCDVRVMAETAYLGVYCRHPGHGICGSGPNPFVFSDWHWKCWRNLLPDWRHYCQRHLRTSGFEAMRQRWTMRCSWINRYRAVNHRICV